MGTVFAGLSVGLCLIAAACIMMMIVAFSRISFEDTATIAPSAALKWRKLLEKQDSVLSALSVAYLFSCIAFVMGATHLLLGAVPVEYFIAYIVLVCALVVLLTWYLPKSYVLRQDVRFCLDMATAINIVAYVFSGPAWVLGKIGTLLTLAGKNHFYHMSHVVSVAHYVAMVDRHRQVLNAVDPEAAHYDALTKNIAASLEITVADIMTPLDVIEVIDGDLSIEEMVDTILDSQAKRMILFQGSPDQIIGILHTQLFAKAVALAGGDLNAVDVMACVSEPIYIRPHTPILEQAQYFVAEKQSFALVAHQGQLLGGLALDRIWQELSGAISA